MNLAERGVETDKALNDPAIAFSSNNLKDTNTRDDVLIRRLGVATIRRTEDHVHLSQRWQLVRRGIVLAGELGNLDLRADMNISKC